MTKIYSYALEKVRDEWISDARNRYVYCPCGEITVTDDMTEYDVDEARKSSGIPDNAIVVSVRLA